MKKSARKYSYQQLAEQIQGTWGIEVRYNATPATVDYAVLISRDGREILKKCRRVNWQTETVEAHDERFSLALPEFVGRHYVGIVSQLEALRGNL